jgi:hypothetical protein
VSQPYHYVLDQLGAIVVAAEQDHDPDKAHWQYEKALAIGRSQRLAHVVGTNGFFSALMAEGRRRDDRALSLWWSERYCGSNFNEIARPDGLGVWEGRGAQVTFCLEYDRSTETLDRLEKKLKSYEDLQIASGYASWILFCFGHPAGKPAPGELGRMRHTGQLSQAHPASVIANGRPDRLVRPLCRPQDRRRHRDGGF